MIPDNVDFMIALDMDETYRPIQRVKRAQSGIQLFEAKLEQLRRELQVVFGLITGSNHATAIKNLGGYANIMPDFIASSLGTELHWCFAGEYHNDPSWNSHIGSVIDFKHRIGLFEAMISPIKNRLIEQPPTFQGTRIKGYYLKLGINNGADMNLLRESAVKAKLIVEVTECSFATGDPEGYFDVAVMPPQGGKAACLQFVSKRLSIQMHQTIAVGDGCNDIAMLSAAGRGYLVGNASASAKKLFPNHANGEYCWGILEALEFCRLKEVS